MSATPTIVSVETTPVPVNQPQSGSAQATPVPQSEWDVIRAQLHETPQNPEAWNKLIDLAEECGEIEKIQASYEGLLQTYPNTPTAQIAYLNHFLNPGSFHLAEALFKRFLRTSPWPELWKFYLVYVRRVNTGPSTRDSVRMAYEFALNHVGQDKDSTEIWIDFIQFLKAGEETSTWEKQQKMDALRKVYHRVVQIPIEGVDRLWQELESFENGLNKITAKKFMGDLSPAHMQARTVLRQLETHLRTLFPPLPPSQVGRSAMHLPRLPTFNPGERALVGAWKAYLKWEESNPLEIEDKDRATFLARMQGVYRKAVVRMRFFAEIWYMAFVWTSSVGKTDEALAILKAGMEANPGSFLLTFAYVEVQELNSNIAEVHATFEKFFDVLRRDLETAESRMPSTNSSFSNGISNQPQEPPQELNNSQHTANSVTTQSSDDKPSSSKELAERRTEFGLAWIMYMRFCRRAEGLKSSRAAFGKARRDRWTPWEVYEASALMEYHCTKAMDVASRIFEKGLELFGDEVDFVLRYLGFLISVNDENNARALFERVIGNFSADKARLLWERWARYVYQFGDLEAAQKLEKRIAEVYPSDPPIKRFAQRHTYLGTDAIAARDLGFAMARQAGTGNTGSNSGGNVGRADTMGTIFSANQQGPSHKRPQSPSDYKRRDERSSSDYGPSHKRQRPLSPPPVRERERDRERDRWDGPPPSRRRYASPMPWERERERDSVAPRRERLPHEKDDEKPPLSALPPILSWFVGMLPAPNSFDGPVFRTDDLMQVFRNAVIPSSNSLRPRSPLPPPPAVRAGRPPPDYGPYQGPGGGRRR